jgi:hypothetical protein
VVVVVVVVVVSTTIMTVVAAVGSFIIVSGTTTDRDCWRVVEGTGSSGCGDPSFGTRRTERSEGRSG